MRASYICLQTGSGADESHQPSGLLVSSQYYQLHLGPLEPDRVFWNSCITAGNVVLTFTVEDQLQSIILMGNGRIAPGRCLNQLKPVLLTQRNHAGLLLLTRGLPCCNHGLQVMPTMARAMASSTAAAEEQSGSSKAQYAAGLGGLFAGLFGASIVASSADEVGDGLHAPHYPWPHKGIFDSYDHASIRRGHQVYQQVGLSVMISSINMHCMLKVLHAACCLVYNFAAIGCLATAWSTSMMHGCECAMLEHVWRVPMHTGVRSMPQP